MRRCFLIDDDKDDAELFQEALEELRPSTRFEHYDNGQDALEQLNAAKDLPDVLFLDINLPLISGWDILAKLKQNHQLARIPVVMFSTSSNPKEKERARELGAIGFITKPSDYFELRHEISKFLV